MVREDQIDAAAVNVDRQLTEQFLRHRRTLDVPPGAPRREPGLPDRLARLRSLPEYEVAGVFLVVLVRINARAALDPRVIKVREPAVLRERRDLEIDRPLARVR